MSWCSPCVNPPLSIMSTHLQESPWSSSPSPNKSRMHNKSSLFRGCADFSSFFRNALGTYPAAYRRPLVSSKVRQSCSAFSGAGLMWYLSLILSLKMASVRYWYRIGQGGVEVAASKNACQFILNMSEVRHLWYCPHIFSLLSFSDWHPSVTKHLVRDVLSCLAKALAACWLSACSSHRASSSAVFSALDAEVEPILKPLSFKAADTLLFSSSQGAVLGY